VTGSARAAERRAATRACWWPRAVAVSIGAEQGGCFEGAAHVGRGSIRFLEILDGQLARRPAHCVPSIDADPAWLVRLPTDPQAQRVAGCGSPRARPADARR
jgi:hypothetical protein